MLNMKRTLILLIMLLFCSGCGSTQGGNSPSTNQSVQVELDVYSGKPNPTWTLSSQKISELVQHLQELTALPSVPTVDNLGYRGFLLHNPGNLSGIGEQIRVFNGVIIITAQGHVNAYKDSRGLETWLIEQARQHGEGETLKAVGK